MRRAALLFCALLFSTLLSACGIQVFQGTREPERYFILEAPAGATATTPVELAPTTAASFYDTQDIAYSRAPGTRAYYQFNHWTERPPRAIYAQLASRFDQTPHADSLVLRTHLEEIYHDAAQRPGAARIRLAAQLAAPSGAVVARRVFTAAAPAASYDAAGAVQGFDKALGILLDELVAWVDAHAAR